MIEYQQPLVTIGIPTYNRADAYLKEAVSSALSQTYQNIEIIISDNCSTDNTELYIKSICDDRLRYIKQQQNIGPINNYNSCLKEAKGDFFLLLHDDDLVDDDFIEICMRNYLNDKEEYGIIRTGTRLIDHNGNITGGTRNKGVQLSFQEYLLSWFTDKTAWYLPSTLFYTKSLKEIGGFNPSFNLVPDLVALFQIEAKYKRLDIEDIKASFRVHPDEITFSSKVTDWCEEFLKLSDIICELLPETENLIKTEGMKFFARLSYKRASKIESPIKRTVTYFKVFKKFRFKYLPPFIITSIYKNPVFKIFKRLKRMKL